MYRNLLKLAMIWIVSLLTLKSGYGQQNYNQTAKFLNANKVWAFASHAGLDFNSGTAVAIQTAIPATRSRQGEGSSSVSDP